MKMIFVFNSMLRWFEVDLRLKRHGSYTAGISLLTLFLTVKLNLLTLSPDFSFILSKGEHSMQYKLDPIVTGQLVLLFFLYQIGNFLEELYFSIHSFPKPTSFFSKNTCTHLSLSISF